MQKYRVKPAVIEAQQWMGLGSNVPGVEEHKLRDDLTMATVKTPSGYSNIKPGDWVIRTEDRDYYVCEDRVFRAIYERVL